MMNGLLSRRNLLKRGVAVGLAVAVLVPAGVFAQEETTFERIQREGVVRVGFSNEAPFAFANADGSGSITGAAPEILRAVLAEVGVETLEGVLTQFGSLIPGLAANRFDIIGAGMFARPTRCEQIDFGDPEYGLGEGFAVAAGNPLGLGTLQDIIDTGADFGLVTGGAEVEYSDLAGVPKEKQVVFPNGPLAIAGLQSGQVDAVMLTSLSIADLVAKSGDDSIEFAAMTEQPLDVDGNPAVGFGAMGFRQEDDDLRLFYNEKLAEMKADGRLLEIMAPFGFSEAEMTDVLATDICPSIS